MPTVPVPPQERQVQQAGLPGVQVTDGASREAFGGGQSLDQATAVAVGAGDTAKQIATEAKQQADQVAFMNADRQASELQTKLSVQVSKMKGQDALGAPDVVAKQWSDNVKQIKDGLANKEQQMAFEQASTKRWESLNEHTQTHLATEQKAFDDEQTQSYLAASKNAATVGANDEKVIAPELERQETAVKQWAARNGLSGSDAEKQKIAAVTSGTMRDVIAARVDSGNTQGAVQYFNDNKGKMVAEDLLHAEKLIESGKTMDAGMDAWKKYGSLKLADGNPDEATMERKIMADPNLSTKEKVEVTSFVKTRAREEIGNKNRQDAANDHAFLNQVIQNRQQGQPLEDSLRMVNNYTGDPYDASIKAEAVRKIYAPPEKSDPNTYIGLWEKIQDKNADKTDIDQAMQKNLINASDWRTLREDQYRINSEGKNDKEKNAYERVKILVAKEFGSDKEGAATFMYDLHQSNKGKTPEDIWKSANDKLKPDPKTGLSLFGLDTGLFKSPQYKTDVERLDAQNLAWGKLHEDIGKKEVNAIGQGILYSGKKSWSVADVDAFASSLGGYQKIQQGTPGHNAIQSLVKHKQLVTPSNVKAVLDKYQDGNY